MLHNHPRSVPVRIPSAAIIVTIVLALPSGIAAQRGTAWFGLTPPPGLGDPHRPVLSVAGVTPRPAQVPAGEERFSDLSGARIQRDLATIVGFSKANQAAGDKAWGRITGFSGAAAALSWAAQQFKDAGLTDVQLQEYTGTAPVWWPKSWSAKLIGDPKFGAGTADVALESALPGSGTMIPGGTLTAPLVFAGNTDAEGSVTVDVKGKVAVQHLTPGSGAFSERGRTAGRARDMIGKGAVAVINVVEQTGNMFIRDFGNCGGPCFNVGAADGVFLEGAIAKAAQAGASGDLKIQMTLDAQTSTGLKGHNAIGIVPGRNTAENIIVNAHGDGWFDAAGDNGDGFATVMALARHFARPENTPERTLVFVISGGHHSTGLNGPANLVKMNPELTKKTVLVVNLEHIAQLYFRPAPWRVEAAEQPMNLGISNSSPALIEIGKRARERYGFAINPTFGTSTAGDLGGYEPLGVSRVQAIHAGPMYHASGDVLESISTPGLERAARFFAYFVNEAARTPRSAINP